MRATPARQRHLPAGFVFAVILAAGLAARQGPPGSGLPESPSTTAAARRGSGCWCSPSSCSPTASGRSAWFLGMLMLKVYAVFAMTLYVLPPGVA